MLVEDLGLVGAHEVLQHVGDDRRVELAADRTAQIAELGHGHGRVRIADHFPLLGMPANSLFAFET